MTQVKKWRSLAPKKRAQEQQEATPFHFMLILCYNVRHILSLYLTVLSLGTWQIRWASISTWCQSPHPLLSRQYPACGELVWSERRDSVWIFLKSEGPRYHGDQGMLWHFPQERCPAMDEYCQTHILSTIHVMMNVQITSKFTRSKATQW